MEKAGRSRNTWAKWLLEPWFNERTVAIRAQRKGIKVPQTFASFRKQYFGLDTYEHQQRLVDALDNAPPGSTILCLLPPEGGKTTTVEDWLCKRIAQKPTVRIGYVSETRTHGERVLSRLVSRMTDEDAFKRYISDFGPFKPSEKETGRPWSATAFTVAKARHDERDRTFSVAGASTKLYGARFDDLILDDYQSIQTLNATQTLLDNYRHMLLTRVHRKGRKIIIGTRIGEGDFYEAILELGLVDQDPIIIEARKPDGKSYFPLTTYVDLEGETREVGWSDDDLKKRELEVGPEIWDTVYMQRPRSAFGATFTAERIQKAQDRDRSLGYDFPLHLYPEGYPCFTTVGSLDPAISGNASFKMCGYAADKMYVLDTASVPKAGSYTKLWDVMEELTIMYHPSTWIIEANALQAGLAREERVKKMADHYGFSIVEHTTTWEKVDPKVGIPAMSDSMGMGQVSIPWKDGDPETHEKFNKLIQELVRWRRDLKANQLQQDEVMSLWFNWRRWRAESRSAIREQQMWRTRSLPWTPMSQGYQTVRAR